MNLVSIRNEEERRRKPLRLMNPLDLPRQHYDWVQLCYNEMCGESPFNATSALTAGGFSFSLN